MENKETYGNYGKFLIKFEYVCNFLRIGILYSVFPEKTSLQQTQVEILTEGLTADPIRKKYLALIQLSNKSDSEVVKLTKIISDVFAEIIPVRNSFAHGTSFIGNNDFNELSKDGTLLLKHPKINANGLDIRFKEFDNETLKIGIELFKSLSRAISKTIILNRKECLEDYEISLLNSTGEELKMLSDKFHKRNKK